MFTENRSTARRLNLDRWMSPSFKPWSKDKRSIPAPATALVAYPSNVYGGICSIISRRRRLTLRLFRHPTTHRYTNWNIHEHVCLALISFSLLSFSFYSTFAYSTFYTLLSDRSTLYRGHVTFTYRKESLAYLAYFRLTFISFSRSRMR